MHFSIPATSWLTCNPNSTRIRAAYAVTWNWGCGSEEQEDNAVVRQQHQRYLKTWLWLASMKFRRAEYLTLEDTNRQKWDWYPSWFLCLQIMYQLLLHVQREKRDRMFWEGPVSQSSSPQMLLDKKSRSLFDYLRYSTVACLSTQFHVTCPHSTVALSSRLFPCVPTLHSQSS